MQIDLTQIILCVITLIFGLITRYAIPYVKDKLDNNKKDLLRIAIKTAVYAAEQIYHADQGQEKMKYVVALLYQQGFILDPDQIEETTRAQIEAMVKELKIEQAK